MSDDPTAGDTSVGDVGSKPVEHASAPTVEGPAVTPDGGDVDHISNVEEPQGSVT